jgi:HSP20 family molecular chaperone IbpA
MATNLMRFFEPFSGIARFKPFRNIDEFFKDFRMMPALRGIESEPRIRMDVAETDQAYMVKAKILGVKKDDIKVAIDGNQVSISAEEELGGCSRADCCKGSHIGAWHQVHLHQDFEAQVDNSKITSY